MQAIITTETKHFAESLYIIITDLIQARKTYTRLLTPLKTHECPK
jgi:hypothetical protein